MPKSCFFNGQEYADGDQRCQQNHKLTCRDGEWNWENEEYCHEKDPPEHDHDHGGNDKPGKPDKPDKK